MWRRSSTQRFQSTLPLRGATGVSTDYLLTGAISIHAPLAGSDAGWMPSGCSPAISIHAPLAGSDLQPCPYSWYWLLFQSTLPLRGATYYYTPKEIADHFNPRSPCGERLPVTVFFNPALAFQSTLPLRGATGQAPGRDQSGAISIHAPLAGSDRVWPHTHQGVS